MAATWDIQITVKNIDAKRISATATITDGADVRTYRILDDIYKAGSETLEQFQERIATHFWQQYQADLSNESAQAAVVANSEAAIVALLNAQSALT